MAAPTRGRGRDSAADAERRRRLDGPTPRHPIQRHPDDDVPNHDVPSHDVSNHDVAAARDRARTLGTPPRRRPPARRGPGGWVRHCVRRYGWRAYALPVLFIVTIAALLSTSSAAAERKQPQAGATRSSNVPATAAAQIPLKNDAPGANVNNVALDNAALPKGAAYTTKGAGTFRILPGHSAVAGKTGQLYRYSIDVENGVDDINLANFQKSVVSVLSDPRSWSGHGVRLQRVDSGPIDFHVTMTSSLTVRTLCGYSIPVETSCYIQAGAVPAADVNRVVFNDARWARGSTAYVGDLAAYRLYMINHEDGHALGHEHAHQCLPGGLAPAMMQQTFGLRSATTKQLCQANPWPYPTGVKGAPGAEQPDTHNNDEYGLGD